MKTRIFILLIIAAFSTKGFAQLGTPLSQFSGNQLLFNPAYAGVYEMLTMNLSLRQQWTQLPGAPRILNFNGHSLVGKSRQALGLAYTREEYGPIVGNYVYGNYSYRIYTRNGALNFGLQAGILNNVIDWNKFKDGVEDPTDPGWMEDRTTTRFDANVGVFYMTDNYYVGFSAKHITRPKFDNTVIRDTANREISWYSQMPTDWYLIAGFRHHFDDLWSIRPELLVRYVHTVPLSVNVGAYMYFTNNYSFGANFMTGQRAVSFVAKAMMTNNFRIGYSYDIYFGPVSALQRGSHEIMINYYIRGIPWDKHSRR